MDAFHVNWTAPYKKKNPCKAYCIEPFELLTTILSALKWQEKNGGICMITDSLGAEYYQSLGLSSLWNLGIRTDLDDKRLEEIDPDVFWAAGKLFALQSFPAPCAMIDTDFIVWETLLLEEYDIAVIHRETIYPDIYPPPESLGFPMEGYDASVLPCNTAFLYIKSQSFKQLYTNASISYMNRMKCGSNPLTYMVFAEQRLLSLLAVRHGQAITALSDLKTLFTGQTLFTHVWGFKQQMRDNPDAMNDFCRKCMHRIFKDYPDYYQNVCKISSLVPFQ